jgi:hypothetical protein
VDESVGATEKRRKGVAANAHAVWDKRKCGIRRINAKHGGSRAGWVTSSFRPQISHGQMKHAYLVVWEDCKVAAFVVGSHNPRLANK